MKYLFTITWVSGFGYVVFRMWLRPESVIMRGGHQVTQTETALFSVAFVVGTAFALWVALPLKRVDRLPHGLAVSNYFTEVEVPFTSIARVYGDTLLNNPPVVVELNAPTRLGRTFMFHPTVGKKAGLSGDLEVIEDLRERIALAATKSRSSITAGQGG